MRDLINTLIYILVIWNIITFLLMAIDKFMAVRIFYKNKKSLLEG